MSEQPPKDHSKRDAETLYALGSFISIMAIPVLIGTIWAENNVQRIVNVGAGLLLLAIGIGMIFRGRMYAKRS